MSLILITPPVKEPVTLEQAKKQCVIEASFTDDDDLLNRLITVVRIHGENTSGRQFVEAEYDLKLNGFPAGSEAIELPRPPFQSITSFSYVDADGEDQTLEENTDFEVDDTGLCAKINPVDSWPTGAKSLTIRFKTGWPLDSGEPTTPEPIKQWILVKVSTFYENREDKAVGVRLDVAAMPRTFIDTYLDMYSVPVV